MLLDGFNHVAILTNDSKRLHAFYEGAGTPAARYHGER
jgi:hypothetical protein